MADDFSYSQSIHVNAPPDEVYALVSDVTRTGEWSPICAGCDWLEDGGPRVGARFVGHNRTPERSWDTTSTVVAAEPGVEFGWHVGESYVHWRYLLEPDGKGTRLTEAWHFRPEGLAMFAERYGADAQRQIEIRRTAAHTGIPATLAALKTILESDG